MLEDAGMNNAEKTAHPRAFAVWFKALDRWDTTFFRGISWAWPKEYFVSIGSLLEAKSISVDPKLPDSEKPIIDKITFGGDIFVTDPDARANYKGRLFWANTGDFIYSKIRVKQGSCAIVPASIPAIAVSPEYPVYRILADKVLPEYFSLLVRCQPFLKILDGLSHGGSTKTRIHPTQFESISIPIPPIPVQQAIVDRWQQAETDKNFVNQSILARRQTLEKALLQELGITVDSLFPRQRAFRLDWNKLERWDLFFYRADFVRLQYDLETLNSRRLGEIAHFITRPWSCENFREETFRYIEISSVNKNKGITGTRLVQVSNAPSRATTLVKTGDLLISTTRPYLGGFAIVPEEYDNCVCTSGFSVIGSVNNTLIDKDFLLSFLKTDAGLKQMERRMTGGLYPAIVQSELENILIPLIPLEQQKEFVRREALINKQIVEHINKLEKHVEQTNIDIEAMILGTKKVEQPIMQDNSP